MVPKQQMQDSCVGAGGLQHGEPRRACPLGKARATRRALRSSAPSPRCQASQAAPPPPPPPRPTSARRPWSTTSASSDPPRSRAQASASSARAMLSAPPETPAAIRGAGSNGPSAVHRSGKLLAVTTHLTGTAAIHVRGRSAGDADGAASRHDGGGQAGFSRSAIHLHPPAGRSTHRFANIGARRRIFGAKFRQSVAGRLLLVDGGQRIGQAEQRIGGVRSPFDRL